MQNIADFQQRLHSLIHNMKQFLISLSFVLLLFSCKKEDVVDITPKQAEDLEMKFITAFPWIIYKVTLNGSNIWDIGLIEACLKDDSYSFKRDSSLIQFENKNICSGNPDSTVTQWTFYEGRKKIIASVLSLTDTAEILLLNESDMELMVDYEGSPVRVFFKKK